MARRNQSKKAQTTDLKLPVRNPVAANPLLGKSQAHGKSRKADRRDAKVSLRKMPFDRTTCFAISAGQVIGSNGIFHSESHSEIHSEASCVLLAAGPASPASPANFPILANSQSLAA